MLIYMFEEKKKHVRTIRAFYAVGRVLCRAAGHPFTLQADRQVRMLLQGMFTKKPDPIIPKPQRIWDVSQVLDYFLEAPPNSLMSLRVLGCKLACLLMLVSMRRCIDLTRLDIGHLQWTSPREARFLLTSPSKTYNYRTRKHIAENLQFFIVTALLIEKDIDKKLCPIRCLRHYLRRTKGLRGKDTALFVISQSPFNPAARPTVAQWVKTIMAKAGIDISIYAPHSVRSASSSKAFNMGISVSHIMRKAGWTKENTFIKHYLKELLPCKPMQPVFSKDDAPVPLLDRISDNHRPEHAKVVEGELDRVRNMRALAETWNKDPHFAKLATIDQDRALPPVNLPLNDHEEAPEDQLGNLAELVAEHTSKPVSEIIETSTGGRQVSHTQSRPIDHDEHDDDHVNQSKPNWLDVLPLHDLNQSDLNQSESCVSGDLPEAPLSPPPGWGDASANDSEDSLSDASSSCAPVSKGPIHIDGSILQKPDKNRGRQGTNQDRGFTAFRQQTIKTSAGKIQKITIIRKHVNTLPQIQNTQVEGLEEIKAPPAMYRSYGQRARPKACIIHDLPINATGERVVEIELDSGSESSGQADNPITLPLVQDELGRIQVLGPEDDGSVDSGNFASGKVVRCNSLKELDYDPHVVQTLVGVTPCEEIADMGPPKNNQSMVSSSTSLPDYQHLSDEVTTILDEQSSGIPVDHADLPARRKKVTKMWRCKICNRLYCHRTGLLMHLNVHQGFRPFTCPDCKVSFYYKRTFSAHRRLGCIKGAHLGN